MAAKRFTVELEQTGKTATQRREHVEWVEDAKRPETRMRRIAATVERALAGEPHSR